MSERRDVVIVGAGQGGAQTAICLRQQKFEGSVALIGKEPHLPYERPALSKEYLADEKSFDKLLLRSEEFWREREVELRLGVGVAQVDARRHRIVFENGAELEYGKLVWATGGAPRRLPGTEGLAGVHTVREREDTERLKDDWQSAERVVIVGGGYIGLEVAAAARAQGKQVTLLEGQDRVLARVAGAELARFFEDEHRARGVEVRLGSSVAGLQAKGGRVSGVRLASGEEIPAEIVVVGIGIDAVVAPLAGAGADIEAGGVKISSRCETSLADVYAIGDCAAHENAYANGRVIRLESVQNANDQALVVAKAIAGTLQTGERYDAVPWFWSCQYDLRLQTIGLWEPHDDVVVRGEPATRSFSVVYLRKGRVVALDCVNRTKDYVQGKALIVSGQIVERERLLQAEVPLKELRAV